MKNIAIMGATGAVGRQMLICLEEENIEVGELRLLASARSHGQKMMFKGKEVVVEELKHDSFEGMDIVLGAVSNALAKEYAPDIMKAGAVFIDNSSAFRMNEDVPLVIPEINGADAKKHKGIIANPNCSTIITMMAVNAIHRLSPIECMITSTYQAVSGAGKDGIDELEGEINGTLTQPQVFPYPIAYNCIPYIGSPLDNLNTTEEMKMENEGRKILHNEGLKVSCTCVRVPVMRSHSIAVSLKCQRPITVKQAREAISKQEGVVLYDELSEKKFPMPILTTDQNLVYVGRIREDRVFEGGITLFCSGDQIRKGAASNAVDIIKCL